ncbi:MAG: Xaa-Pro peptidase family protein [Chloroflexota bacterium]|nr:Xaa-Pro peptidase family protein [Chloroflexota bacterium]
MPSFTGDEYRTRIARTRQRMAEAGLDLLIVSDPANMNYLTGYDGWSFYTPQCVVVPGTGDDPLVIVRGMDRNGGLRTSFLPAARILGYPDHYVQARDLHPFDWITDELRRHGYGRGRVGTEQDAYYFSPAARAALERGLPEAAFVDANLLVNWVRAVKSEAELSYMEQAARIVEATMAAAYDAIAPGVRQCDAVAAIAAAQIRGTPEYGGDYAAFVPLIPTGIGTSTPHLTWTDAPFVSGEPTILELAGCRHRYHCPMARTLYLGRPPAKLRQTEAVVREGLQAALDAAMPGTTAEGVEAVWRRVAARGGVSKESRIGYSVGLNYPPAWGEHTISLRPGDNTILEPNMTLHLILGIWLDDWGLEISECFRVTDTGAQPFCDFPRGLHVKD